MHPTDSSYLPIKPSIPVLQYIHSFSDYVKLSVTHIQYSQLLHAHVATPTSILLTSFLSRLFWSSYLYFSLFQLYIFRYFFPVVLFIPSLSFPVRVLLSLFLSFPSFFIVILFTPSSCISQCISFFSSRSIIPSLLCLFSSFPWGLSPSCPLQRKQTDTSIPRTSLSRKEIQPMF